MKTSPTDPIHAGLKVISNLETEIPALNQQLTDHAAELAGLAATGDLDDEKVLSRIARLQTFTGLFPARITAREISLETAQNDLLKTCHTFIGNEANPRAGRVTRAMSAKVKAELKAHFTDESQLERAVAQSDLVRECSSISFTRTENPEYGAVKYAQELLAQWASLLALEAKL